MTSERTLSICMGLDDNLSSPKPEYSFDDSSVFDRSSSSESSSGKASLSGQQLRDVILPNDWSIHDFPVDMSDEVFGRLRPRFQIPDNVPIRKGDLGEKCYDGKSFGVGFYEAAFIAGLRLPFTTFHRWLASYLGVSVSQIALNA